jgi:Flp pilus assembly protein TadG
MNRIARHLIGDRRGLAVVEFAMIAPIFAMLVLGAVDLANGFARRVVLEQAANRVVQLSDVVRPTSDTDVAHLRSEAVAAAGAKPEDVTIDVYLLCNRQRKSDYDDDCSSGQVSERHVSVKVRSIYKPVFHFISKIWSTPQGVVLTGSADSRIQ